MGLDSVEFIMELEAAFELEIPDAAARAMLTPRHVIDYLHGQLPPGSARTCLSQRAFYRLRGALARRGAAPAGLTPGAVLTDVLPADRRDAAWRELRADFGAERWPKLYDPSWWNSLYGDSRPLTLGALANYAAARNPHVVKRGGEGWTRAEVRDVVFELMRLELGVDKFTEESRFVDDLGVD